MQPFFRILPCFIKPINHHHKYSPCLYIGFAHKLSSIFSLFYYYSCYGTISISFGEFSKYIKTSNLYKWPSILFFASA
ncbi:hypothetical protein L1887_02832 [Cichorium endivia]|nr:hypothetical protein L1887_02832 [Cichorium endivia]